MNETNQHHVSNAFAKHVVRYSITVKEEKEFFCKICSCHFRQQEHLKCHHRSIHAGEKRFQCKFCSKAFSRSDNCNQHQRVHLQGDRNRN